MKQFVLGFISTMVAMLLLIFVAKLCGKLEERPTPTPSVAPVSRAAVMAMNIERVMSESPDDGMVISAMFASTGPIKIVLGVPPYVEWRELSPPCGPPIIDEIEAEIERAIAHGALQFQLVMVAQKALGTFVSN